MHRLLLLILLLLTATGLFAQYTETTRQPVLEQGGIQYKTLQEVYDASDLVQFSDTNQIATKHDIDTLSSTVVGLDSRIVADSLRLDSLWGTGQYVNVKDFGAVGDGISNDNVEIQEALDSADSWNKKVLFPAGTYLANTTLNLPSNIEIIGIGYPVVQGVFTIDNDSNIVVRGMEFQSWNVSSNYAIRIGTGGVYNLIVDDCRFTNKTYIHQDAPSGSSGKDIIVKNSYMNFQHDGTAGVVGMNFHAGNITVRDNKLRVTNADGIIKTQGGTGFNKIINNEFSGDLLEEVYDPFKSKVQIDFSGNNIDLERGGIIRTKPGLTADQAPYPYEITVQNNIIRHRRNTANLIYISGANELTFEDSLQTATIRGNIFRLDSVDSPINVRGLHSAIISDNIIVADSAVGWGIYVSAIDQLNISNNNLQKGGIIGFAANTPSAEVYDTILINGQWNISNNTIVDPELNQFSIYIFNQDSISLSIAENTIGLSHAVHTAAIRIANSDVRNLHIEGNSVFIRGAASSTANSFDLSNSTYDLIRENGNSWYGAIVEDSIVFGAQNAYIKGVATNNMAFHAGGSERMRINSGGNIGIGTTSVTADKLGVVGTIASSVGYSLGDDVALGSEIGHILNQSGDFKIRGDGVRDVALGSETFGDILFLNGSSGLSTFSGDVVVPSDVYDSGWDGTQQAAPKDAIYDKIESLNQTKELFVSVFGSGSAVSTGDGTAGLPLPSSFNGMDLINVVVTVHDKGVTGTTDVQVRRRRAGTDVDMLTVKVTVGDEWYAEDETVNTTNDDVQTGDIIYVDIDSIHTTPPNGLSVALIFQNP